jgi:hypothetical protein
VGGLIHPVACDDVDSACNSRDRAFCQIDEGEILVFFRREGMKDKNQQEQTMLHGYTKFLIQNWRTYEAHDTQMSSELFLSSLKEEMSNGHFDHQKIFFTIIHY